MMSRLCVLGAVIFIFSLITESSSQFWRRPNEYSYPPQHGQRYRPNYYPPRQQIGFPQQNDFPNNIQLPPGVSVTEAEWVCKNSKTGDMVSQRIY
jgi:hypothetical protein